MSKFKWDEQEPTPLNDETHSDIIVKFGQNTVFAHKVYLARHSLYFRRAFKSQFSVANSKVVDLGDDDSPTLVHAMLGYIYDGDDYYDKLCSMKFNDNDRFGFHFDMFIMGDKYDIPSLRKHVVSQWEACADICLITGNATGPTETLSPIACSVQKICGPQAMVFADKSLQDRCLDFCSQHMVQLLDNKVFSTLLEEGLLLDASFLIPLLISSCKSRKDKEPVKTGPSTMVTRRIIPLPGARRL